MKISGHRGFTIVELLIVIVVIGILAALVIGGFSQAQTQARNAKIAADLNSLHKAIITARNNTGKVLGEVTGTHWTGSACMQKTGGTDLAALNKSTDACWTRYYASLDAISAASGAAGIKDLTDPWGRPYYIDENEGENAAWPCTRDKISAYPQPLEYSESLTIGNIWIRSSLPAC